MTRTSKARINITQVRDGNIKHKSKQDLVVIEEPLEIRLIAGEDVGRHNAMDKVVGWAVQQKELPLNEAIILVSGRASFELIQKALAVQIPIFCAVSAPSSQAVDLAYRFDMTLIRFLRDNNFNIYTVPRCIKSQ